MDDGVFRALLALDSYNRGYHPGIFGLSEAPDTSLGTATIIASDGEDPASNVGFYAIAYEWDGETIISYRGTDEIPNFPQVATAAIPSSGIAMRIPPCGAGAADYAFGSSALRACRRSGIMDPRFRGESGPGANEIPRWCGVRAADYAFG